MQGPIALALAAAMLALLTGAPAAEERGTYTKAQAAAGKQVYADHCARCHGTKLEGGQGPALVGKGFEKSLDVDHITANQLYDFITSHMPRNEPGFLTDEHYLAAFAYLLSANGYPAGRSALTKEKLRSVKLRPFPRSGRDVK